MIVLEYDGLIKTANILNCGLVQFVKHVHLLQQNNIAHRTRRDMLEGEVVNKMFIIFDSESDYTAFQLIKD